LHTLGFELSEQYRRLNEDLEIIIIVGFVTLFLSRVFFTSQRWDLIKSHILEAILFTLLIFFLVLYLFGIDSVLTLLGSLLGIQETLPILIAVIKIYLILLVVAKVIQATPILISLQRHSAQVIVASFVTLIIFGALSLMMPRATVNGEGLSFVNALFISTSAVCVTGLIVVDTATHFTTLGQSIILVLICMGLLKADVSRIIARAGSDTQEAILNRIGISEVIHPEKDESEWMAAQLIYFLVSDYFELSKDIAIYEIEAPEDMQGYTLQDLKIGHRYRVNLLTIVW